MRIMNWLVGVFALACVATANAKDISQMTDEELGNLPREIRDILPAIDLGIRQDAILAKYKNRKPDPRRPIFELEIMLSDLKYYSGIPDGAVDAELTESIRNFQRKLGAEPTGILLEKQHNQLIQDYTKIRTRGVTPLAPSQFVYGDSETVVVEGTWVFRGEQQAHPIQLSKIECSRREGVCRHSLAMIQYTDLGDYLAHGGESFQITKWTPDQVVAENSAPRCVSYTLTIALRTKSVQQFRRSKEIKDERCKGIAEQSSVLELVDPSKVASGYYRQRENERLKVMNPKYAEKLRVYYELMDAVGLTERY